MHDKLLEPPHLQLGLNLLANANVDAGLWRGYCFSIGNHELEHHIS